MLLSLRGWDERMFRAARPELLSGARFALYAERLMPLYEKVLAIQNEPLPKGNRAAYAASAQAKLAVGEAIPLLRSVLFPEDDDGIA